MARQKVIYARTDLHPPRALVDAVRNADPPVVEQHLDDNAQWAWAAHLLLLACRVPGHEGHGGRIAEAHKRQIERVRIVELFVQHGAPATLRNNRKVTPQHMACRFDLPRVAKRLAELGGEVNAYDEARETPLYRAVNLGYVECVHALLHAGANPNFRNRRGETPLHRAAMRGKRFVVPPLLAAGADPRLADRAGRRPLDYARNKHIRHLLEAG